MKITYTKNEAPVSLTITVSEPTFPEPKKLTKEDVWGIFDIQAMKWVSNGMMVEPVKGICRVFGDRMPFKSVTVVCLQTQFNEVAYWLEFVHGAGSITKVKVMDDNTKVAIRSEYNCW